MASEYCLYKSEHEIPDYDICVPSDVLGEQLYYYRHCFFLRYFISECSLKERYCCNDVIKILPEHFKTLYKELSFYIKVMDMSSKDKEIMLELKRILGEILETKEYTCINFYLEYTD